VTADAAAPSISIRGLSHRFGSLPVLREVDLDVAHGESLALVGPNGAGKTTLLRLLTQTLRMHKGEIRIAGLDPRRHTTRALQHLGLLSHQSLVYEELTARENLEFFGRLYGMDSPGPRCAELLEELGLGDRADDPAGTYSRGMRQRLSLARALVHDPEIVLLDEPFTGLDPLAARRLRRMLERLRDRKRSVVLVTHNLGEALELSDRWAILVAGRIVDQGDSASTSREELERRYLAHGERPTTAAATS